MDDAKDLSALCSHISVALENIKRPHDAGEVTHVTGEQNGQALCVPPFILSSSLYDDGTSGCGRAFFFFRVDHAGVLAKAASPAFLRHRLSHPILREQQNAQFLQRGAGVNVHPSVGLRNWLHRSDDSGAGVRSWDIRRSSANKSAYRTSGGSQGSWISVEFTLTPPDSVGFSSTAFGLSRLEVY